MDDINAIRKLIQSLDILKEEIRANIRKEQADSGMYQAWANIFRDKTNAVANSEIVNSAIVQDAAQSFTGLMAAQRKELEELTNLKKRVEQMQARANYMLEKALREERQPYPQGQHPTWSDIIGEQKPPMTGSAFEGYLARSLGIPRNSSDIQVMADGVHLRGSNDKLHQYGTMLRDFGLKFMPFYAVGTGLSEIVVKFPDRQWLIDHNQVMR